LSSLTVRCSYWRVSDRELRGPSSLKSFQTRGTESVVFLRVEERRRGGEEKTEEREETKHGGGLSWHGMCSRPFDGQSLAVIGRAGECGIVGVPCGWSAQPNCDGRQAMVDCCPAVRTEQNGIMISMRRGGPLLGDLLICVPSRDKRWGMPFVNSQSSKIISYLPVSTIFIPHASCLIPHPSYIIHHPSSRLPPPLYLPFSDVKSIRADPLLDERIMYVCMYEAARFSSYMMHYLGGRNARIQTEILEAQALLEPSMDGPGSSSNPSPPPTSPTPTHSHPLCFA
jgi:hypothetical protein